MESKQQDVVTIIQSRHDVFYDDERQENKDIRQYSEIFFLKKFNNWIKTVLINQTVYNLGSRVNPSIFDICSGKGGDLGKWIKQKPTHYVSLELQRSLVDKAEERLKNMKGLQFPSILIAGDAGDENATIDKILSHEKFKDIKNKIEFDIVSCQFSLHYLYESEKQLNAFLYNVTCRLVPGGYFIGTTIDSEKVAFLIRTDGQKLLKISNQYFSVQFGQDHYPKAEDPYGLKYYFYLKDAIGKQHLDKEVYVPEYLVPFEHLQKKASEYGLELMYRQNFHQFYEKNIHKNEYLFEKMVNTNDIKETPQDEIDDQWEMCGLYQVFVFRKIGDYDFRKEKQNKQHFGNFFPLRKHDVKEWV